MDIAYPQKAKWETGGNIHTQCDCGSQLHGTVAIAVLVSVVVLKMEHEDLLALSTESLTVKTCLQRVLPV
jgi:hypothetical protein